jgi:ADP-ribose pyrophosphatase YjhB (NUDIX family)
MIAVGAVIVQASRVLLVRRGTPPLKGHWTLPGGVLELGESLLEGVVREVREETGLIVNPIELIELVDRIHRNESRIQFHYVIADYLCRMAEGQAKAASDADEVRWVRPDEWRTRGELMLDPITVAVIEKGWQRAQALWPG